ncbi:MAG TPA: hypothetical protein VHY31_15710 [Streptosporangiaceae bacterium]|nr:hypothetical protein [Streptosporangiaceae bacterium]
MADHRPLLGAAGFDVLSYEETRDWRERQERTGQALLAAAADLAAESGRPAAELRAGIADERHGFMHDPPRARHRPAPPRLSRRAAGRRWPARARRV